MQNGDYPPGVTDDDINRWDNGDLHDDEWDDIEADLKEDVDDEREDSSEE